MLQGAAGRLSADGSSVRAMRTPLRRVVAAAAGAVTAAGLSFTAAPSAGATTATTTAGAAITTAGTAPAATSHAPTGRAASGRDSLFPGQGTDAYDVRHYDVALDYAKAGTISATTTVRATAARPLPRIDLDLEGLTVRSVSVDGRDATWSRTGTKLHVVPRATVHGDFTVVVRYGGRPVTHIDPDGAKDGWVPTADGATVLSEPVGAQTWFPDNNTPADKASFRVAVTVPAGTEVAGNGVLSGESTRAGRTTWTWVQREPMATYLAMISIGQYDVYRSSLRLADGRTIPVTSFIDPDLGSQAAARAQIAPAVRFLERHFGPYPFSSVGIVASRIKVGYALETQTRPFFDGPVDTSTLVHELAHQWYGDSVTPADWGDIWLNEGFATYAEWWWQEAHGGQTRAEAFAKAYATAADDELWGPAPADLHDPALLFSDAVYTRGAMTLEALRHRIGSAAFDEVLQRWATTKEYRSTDTDAFVALAERVSGQRLDGFFDTWLYTPGKPARP